MELLPVGSILERNESKIAIVGYYLDDEHTCYSCVPYPFGLVSPEEVIQIDAYLDFDIIHTGYKNDTYTQLMEFLDQLQASYEEFGAEEVSKTVSDILKQVQHLSEEK